VIPKIPKAIKPGLLWFFFFIQFLVFPAFSCRTEQKSNAVTDAQRLKAELAELQHREKVLKHEIEVGRKSEPYLMLDRTNLRVELKARGRIFRSFKIQNLKSNLDKIPDDVQVLSDLKPIQRTERPRIKPGEGEDAIVEAARKKLWGPDRMPRDYDLACTGGLILEIRALPSEKSGSAPVNFVKTVYRKVIERYRKWKSSDEIQPGGIQLWLDEDDARLLFWSLPKKFSILIC
jgi:hypothetical protein